MAMSIDIEGLKADEQQSLKKALTRRLGPLKLEERLAVSSPFRRISELPLAILRSLFLLNPGYMTVAARYAFDGIYISYRRRRYGYSNLRDVSACQKMNRPQHSGVSIPVRVLLLH